MRKTLLLLLFSSFSLLAFAQAAPAKDAPITVTAKDVKPVDVKSTGTVATVATAAPHPVTTEDLNQILKVENAILGIKSAIADAKDSLSTANQQFVDTIGDIAKREGCAYITKDFDCVPLAKK